MDEKWIARSGFKWVKEWSYKWFSGQSKII